MPGHSTACILISAFYNYTLGLRNICLWNLKGMLEREVLFECVSESVERNKWNEMRAGVDHGSRSGFGQL